MKLWFDGRIQIDGAAFWGEDYQPVGNGVALRRVRLGANIAFGEHIQGKIEAEFAGGEFSLKDAFIQYTVFKGLAFRVGNFKEAFSIESQSSSNDLFFLERSSVIAAFAPERHLGVQGMFRHHSFLGMAGIHFQEVNGIKEKDNTEDNNKMGRNEGISYTVRSVWMPQSLNRDKGLHIGAAVSYRTPKNDVNPEFPNSARYAPSISSVNKIKFVDTGLITEVSHDWRTGVEFAGYYKAFRVQGEYIMSNTSRYMGLPTEKFKGFYMQAAYVLFGGRQVYNSDRGAFSQPTAGKKWGDMEIAARFDRVDLNGIAVKGGRSNQFTFGLNYYINSNLKIQLNYSYLDNDRNANADGDAAVGRKPDGQLAYKPEDIDPAFGTGGNDYNSLSIRFQLKF